MEVQTKIDMDILRDYEARGLISSQSHPDLSLLVWKYTRSVQYSGDWDWVTMFCRGLVTDINGIIIGRGMRKFFNIEEARHVPTNEFVIYDKLDGSLLLLYNYNGEWLTSTSGSFESDQAKMGLEYLNEFYPEYVNLNKDYTYLFEYISPENRIVVNYGNTRDVILIAVKNTVTGEELDIHNTPELDFFNKVDVYDFDNYTEIKGLNWDNKEGFIVKFSNGERCKVKFEDYVRLHAIVTELSTTKIWEDLKDNDGELSEAFLDAIPDEYYDEIRSVADDLSNQVREIDNEVTRIFTTEILGQFENRGELARYVTKTYPKLSGYIFNALDGKPYKDKIWKQVKPEYARLGSFGG